MTDRCLVATRVTGHVTRIELCPGTRGNTQRERAALYFTGFTLHGEGTLRAACDIYSPHCTSPYLQYGLTVVTLSCACVEQSTYGRAYYYASSAEGEGGCGGGGSLAVPRESDGRPARALCIE